MAKSKPFVFPRAANYLLPALVLMVAGGAIYAPTIVTFGFSPKTTDVGYAPEQPIPYSHELHAGKLGLDCTYCHTTVDKAAFAAIPPTQTCMNCHTGIKPDSPKFQHVVDGKPISQLKESWETGRPLKWIKVHDLADFSYFNHGAHVAGGIGCVSCHGRIDQMEVVAQNQPLSMGWCLSCHRNPENFLRPKDQITNMAYKPAQEEGETLAQAQTRVGLDLKAKYKIHDAQYMTSCSTCHR